MKRIGIVGANGQVGSEVCLLLRMMEDVEPVPICRSEIASAFLRRCGFECRHGDVSVPADARRVLADLDVVADFSLPSGPSAGVRAAMRSIIPNIAKHAPRGIPMIYLSSITAFGIPDFHSPLREYVFSRNNYGACKRYAERLVRQANRDTYTLRAGVVHGELQAVTRKMVHDIRLAGDVPVYVPDCESYTVFAFSVAEAMAGIAQGKERPGCYTLVSNPGWRWIDLHGWYARRAGVEPHIVPIGPDEAGGGATRVGALSRAQRVVKDLVAGYLGAAFPAVENHLRGVYHRRGAAAEIAAGMQTRQYRPYGNNHTVFPGRRLACLSDSRQTMTPYAAELRNVLRDVTMRPVVLAAGKAGAL
jgi:dTDP-4-dehydrorhamnose reductase